MLIAGRAKMAAEFEPVGSLRQATGKLASMISGSRDIMAMTTARAQRIHTKKVLEPQCVIVRKTKLVCTLGPRCWSEEGISALLDSGLDIARLDFSHGTHDEHQRVFDRFKSVCAAKGSHAAVLLDTKGPEIITAMLRDGKDIELEAGQEISVVAVGDEFSSWEGFKDPESGETKIGLSYAKLCQSVAPGNVILLADGSVSIKVS
jgi:pyruvate kinase